MSSSVFETTANGTVVEVSTFAHEGRSFTALGSVVDKANGYVVGYPRGRVLATWDGKPLGTCRVVSSYPTPRSWLGSRMYCYRAVIESDPGAEYHGRGFGDGMILRLRRCVPKAPRRAVAS
jgi:hypothetical protein